MSLTTHHEQERQAAVPYRNAEAVWRTGPCTQAGLVWFDAISMVGGRAEAAGGMNWKRKIPGSGRCRKEETRKRLIQQAAAADPDGGRSCKGGGSVPRG